MASPWIEWNVTEALTGVCGSIARAVPGEGGDGEGPHTASAVQFTTTVPTSVCVPMPMPMPMPTGAVRVRYIRHTTPHYCTTKRPEVGDQ
jgi:hypothetical protein